MNKLFNNPLFTNDYPYKIDTSGAVIEGARLDPYKAYSKIPDYLQSFIDKKDENSWKEISNIIDYIYDCIFILLKDLNEKTNFMEEVNKSLEKNKLLLFKPNILSPDCIDPGTHHKGSGYNLCTQWPIVAAIMRWFHDYGHVHYSHMALGEGCVDLSALLYSKAFGVSFTNEALIEGLNKNIYGGWGFYFVRKYLQGYCTTAIDDNPMNGYEESCTGTYLPPGKAINKMMFYDTNLIQDDYTKGRRVLVPNGKNYNQIIIHKVIVGGDPENPQDLNLYPGCVLINIPVLKLHAQDMITNSIKNLGIGLYPSKCAETSDPSDKNWLYASPNDKLANTRAKLPHSPWVMKVDRKTGIPIKNSLGGYISKKTYGFSGTQLDLIKVLQSQGVFMIHISDSINIINMSHTDGTLAVPVPEGFVWASLDCVALDLFCARYCFKTIPMALGRYLKKRFNFPTEFLRKVPVAKIVDKQIITSKGFDSPLFRYSLFKDAEKWGIGSCNYYVSGLDWTTGKILGSCQGHLIKYRNKKFYEIMTKTLYYNPVTILYSLQSTILSYAKACDELFQSTLYKDLLNLLDENHDGIIDYNEKGRGYETAQLEIMSRALNIEAFEDNGLLKGPFYQNAKLLRYSNPNWNEEGHDYMKERILLGKFAYAFQLSLCEEEKPDLFYPNMTYGKGNWPSFKTAEYLYHMSYLYGGISLDSLGAGSLYYCLFQYCDEVMNSGYYTKNKSYIQALTEYFQSLKEGHAPLNFTFYVPRGLGKMQGTPIPNTIETQNPNLILTGQIEEIW